MAVAKILWVDDEIESLQSQKFFWKIKDMKYILLPMVLMPLIM